MSKFTATAQFVSINFYTLLLSLINSLTIIGGIVSKAAEEKKTKKWAQEQRTKQNDDRKVVKKAIRERILYETKSRS